MPTETGQISINFEGERADTVFFDPLFLGMEASGMFRVMTNVVHKKDIGFIGHLSNILQKDTGCGFTPKGDLSMYQRTIEVDRVKVDLTQCADELNNTIWEESKRKGVNQNDLRGTIMSQVALTRINQGISLDTNRLFWFGNKKSTDVSYNLLDGMWTIHLPELTNGANPPTPYVNSNSGAPLAPGDALELLKEIWKAQSLNLKGFPRASKRFFVSRSIYEAYMDDLENLGGGDAGRTATINGVEMLAYRGIPLVEMPLWDEYSETDLNQPDKHLALLTIPSNLVLATDLMSSMNQVKIWFDDFREQTDYKVKFKLGSNYVHPSLMVAAY